MLTPEQNGNLLADAQAHGTDRAFDEAYRLGVAAEQKRIMSVLSKMIDGDSPGDRALTEAMNRIERG